MEVSRPWYYKVTVCEAPELGFSSKNLLKNKLVDLGNFFFLFFSFLFCKELSVKAEIPSFLSPISCRVMSKSDH